MKKRIIAALLALSAVALTGCGSILEREYSSVAEHTSRYWENENTDTLRAEDYQSLVNDLLVLVADHTEKSTVRFYNYADEKSVKDDLDSACTVVKMEDALGAYAVDYIVYTVSEGRDYFEAVIDINYSRTSEELAELVNISSTDGIAGLVADAVFDGKTALALHIGYMGCGDAEIQTMVTTALGQEFADGGYSVAYYPNVGEIGDTRIVTIAWSPSSSGDTDGKN